MITNMTIATLMAMILFLQLLQPMILRSTFNHVNIMKTITTVTIQIMPIIIRKEMAITPILIMITPSLRIIPIRTNITVTAKHQERGKQTTLVTRIPPTGPGSRRHKDPQGRRAPPLRQRRPGQGGPS